MSEATLTPQEREQATKALDLALFSHSPDWIYGRQVTGLMRDNLASLERQLAKFNLAIQPVSAGFVNVKLLAACHQALRVISEIADIDAENRAGWCHKELQQVINEATRK